MVSFLPSRHAGFVILANAAPVAITSTTYAGKLLWPLILEKTQQSRQPLPQSAAGAGGSPRSAGRIAFG